MLRIIFASIIITFAFECQAQNSISPFNPEHIEQHKSPKYYLAFTDSAKLAAQYIVKTPISIDNSRNRELAYYYMLIWQVGTPNFPHHTEYKDEWFNQKLKADKYPYYMDLYMNYHAGQLLSFLDNGEINESDSTRLKAILTGITSMMKGYETSRTSKKHSQIEKVYKIYLNGTLEQWIEDQEILQKQSLRN